MSLETHLDHIQSYIETNRISDKDVLALFANYLLNNISLYEAIDTNANLLPTSCELSDFENYSEVSNLLEYFPLSTSLQLAKVSHQLLYVYNQIRLIDEKTYGNGINMKSKNENENKK